MILRNILLALTLLSSACSPIRPSTNGEHPNATYKPVGVVRYFLPNIPRWAHFSESQRCFRSHPTRYLNYETLRESFNYSYAEAAQFQLLINREWQKLRALAYQQSVPIREEETLFFRVSDMVKARLYSFRPPSFERVHLVLVDDFIANPDKVRQLKILMNSERMAQGHPVFVSVCAHQNLVEDFLDQHDLNQQNIRLLTSELLSAYSPENELMPAMKVYLDLFFQPQQKLVLFAPGGVVPTELEGSYELKSF